MEDPVKERELLDMFKQIDVDGSKTLSLNEIILYLKSLTEDISEDNIVQIFSNFDKTGDRMVDFEEFKVVMQEVADAGWKKLENGDVSGISDDEIRQIFNLIDKDKSGQLSKREAKKACKLIQDRFGIKEVEEWIAGVDYDGDGQLSFEEFKFSLAGAIDIAT